MRNKIIVFLSLLTTAFLVYLSCTDIVNPFPPEDTNVTVFLKNSKGDVSGGTLITDTIGKSLTLFVVPYLYSNIDSVYVTISNVNTNAIDTSFGLDKFISSFDTIQCPFSIKTPGARNVKVTVLIKNLPQKEVSLGFVIVSRPIQIQSQPADVGVSENGQVSFSVVAFGNDEVQYQWLKNGSLIPGSIKNILTISSVKTTDAGSYLCVIRNNYGDSIRSKEAKLVVSGLDNPLPVNGNAPKWQLKTINLQNTQGSKITLDLGDKYSGDSVKLSLVPGVPQNDTLDAVIYSFTSALTDSGNYTPQIIAQNALGSDTLTINLTVTVADVVKPVITLVSPLTDSASTNSSSYSVVLKCIDASGIASVTGTMDALTYIGAKDTGSNWSIPVTGLVANSFNAISFTVTDNSEKANKADFVVHIKNDPAMVDGDGPAIRQISGPVSGSVIANPVISITDSIVDPSGIDSVYWTLNGVRGGMVVAGSNNLYSFADTLTAYHLDTIAIYAQDKSAKKNKSKQVIILNYNVPVTWKSKNILASVNEGATYAMVLSDSCNNPDSDPLTFSFLQNASTTGSIIQNKYSYTPTYADSGSRTVKIRVNDGFVSDTLALTIKVVNVNRKPVFVTDTPKVVYTVAENAQLAFSVRATDPDNDVVTCFVKSTTLPRPATATFSSGAFAWTSAYGDTGSYTIIFGAFDKSDTVNLSVTVTIGAGGNRAPVISDIADVNVKVGAAVTFNVAATDPDGDKVTLTSSTLPAGATFTGGAFSWPQAVKGVDTISFTAKDPKGASTKMAVIITVSNNSSPIVTLDPVNQTVLAGKPVTFTSTATGTGVTYQWRLNGQDIKDAKDSILKIASVTISDSGMYACVASNDGGNTLSKTAKLTIQYTVSYDGNTNSGGTVPASANVNCGSTVTVAANTGMLVKTGYAFDGWNTKADGTGTSYTAGTGTFLLGAVNVFLFAKWKINTVTVTFDENGGKTKANPTSKTTNYGTSLGSLPTAPTRDGYNPDGWKAADNTDFTASTKVMTDMTVKEQWSLVNYKINYTLASGETNPTGAPTSYNITSPDITLPTPSKYGNDFTGWYDAGGTKQTKITKGSTGDQNLTATWSAKTLNITYYVDGTLVTNLTPSTFKYSKDAVNLPSPSKSNYQFDGWYTGSNYATKLASNQVAAWYGDNISVYGRYQMITYTVSFDMVGGNPVAGNQTINSGGTASAPTEPNKSGMYFDGWYYGTSATTWNFSTKITNDVKLTAHWGNNPTKPTISRTGSGAVCAGTSVTLTANANNATYYKWYSGSCVGGKLEGEGADKKSITVTPSSTLAYYAVACAKNGAVLSDCSDPYTININQKPFLEPVNASNWTVAQNCGGGGWPCYRVLLYPHNGHLKYRLYNYMLGGWEDWVDAVMGIDFVLETTKLSQNPGSECDAKWEVIVVSDNGCGETAAVTICNPEGLQ